MTQPTTYGGRPYMPASGSPAPELRVARFRGHARRLVWSALVAIAVAAASGYFWNNLPAPLENWMLLTAAAVVILLLAVVPFAAWWGRTYTITTRRVIERTGIFGSHQRELIHVRGYSIAVRRGLLQRMWGAGTLTLANGVDAPLRIKNVPSVVLVHEALVDQVEVSQILAHRDAQPLPPPLPPPPVVERHFETKRPGPLLGQNVPMSLRVGVVGGGQLARMMIAPAVELGVELRVLAEEEGMAASLAATAVGDHHDTGTVLAFARDVDVLTFDHEHVPQPVLRALVDAGLAVHPGPDALQYAQDKLLMRTRLAELGMPQPEWAAVTTEDQLQAFIDDHGGRAVVKTPRGGYDGKGVRVVRTAAEAADWFAALVEDGRGGALLAEELVGFARELAQQVARRPSGEVSAYPVVETVQRDGVCAEVLAPAPHAGAALTAAAARLGVAIAEGLDVTGMLAVELFETADHRILVNELAMRPHNSGHWSQDGAVTGQFEQHLRAVLDLPLGDTAPRAPWSVMINILGGPESGSLDARFAAAMHAHPEAKIHTYGKAPRPGRKVGHVTVAGDDLDDVAYAARAAASFFA